MTTKTIVLRNVDTRKIVTFDSYAAAAKSLEADPSNLRILLTKTGKYKEWELVEERNIEVPEGQSIVEKTEKYITLSSGKVIRRNFVNPVVEAKLPQTKTTYISSNKVILFTHKDREWLLLPRYREAWETYSSRDEVESKLGVSLDDPDVFVFEHTAPPSSKYENCYVTLVASKSGYEVVKKELAASDEVYQEYLDSLNLEFMK